MDHPRAVGETYPEHLASAWTFGARLFLGSLACFLHGLFPFLFVKTGSTTVRALYRDMLTERRSKRAAKEPEFGAYI